MSRTTQESSIATRTARAKLINRSEPYYRSISLGLALGYRSGQRGGTWLARIRLPDQASYVEKKLARADEDGLEANGSSVLTFDQATAAAREAFATLEARRTSGALPGASRSTLNDVFDLYRAAYLAGKTGRRKAPGRDITNVDSILKCHLRPRLGDIRLDRLNAALLEAFKADIVVAPRLSRTGLPVADTSGDDEWDESEALRKRKARANRVMTPLRAALNYARKEKWFASDAAWATALVAYGDVDAASIRFLEVDEAVRLKAAVEEDFRQLVNGALQTGCRYGSLRYLTCGDVNLKARTALVRVTKSGDTQTIHLSPAGAAFLSAIMAGKKRSDFVFTKASGNQWKPSDQQRRMEKGCKDAAIDPAITFHELRDTFASHLVMAGVPLLTVSKLLGHKDIRTTEKYYAHLAPSHLKTAIDDHLPAF